MTINNTIEKEEVSKDLEEMAKAGLHFGHRTSRIHPKMKPYIAGIKNGVNIIDLEKTSSMLNEALEYIKKVVGEGKTVLLVGTKIQIKNYVRETAEECGLPYVSERWLGGTFTNFNTIKKRIDYFKDLERQKESGELNKYTKKERADFDKEIADLNINFSGIKNMDGLPEAIFIADMNKETTAIREAKRKNVKIIGVTDTNVNPELADYPIPANDDAISSVRYILDRIKKVVIEAKPKK